MINTNLDKIKFVRGANYMNQMTDIVNRQDNELAKNQSQLNGK